MKFNEYLKNLYKIERVEEITGPKLIELSGLSSNKAFEISCKLNDEYDSFILEAKFEMTESLKNNVACEDVYWYSGDEEDERYIEYGLLNLHDDCDNLLICGNLEAQYLFINYIDMINYLYNLSISLNCDCSLSLGSNKTNLVFYISPDGIELIENNYQMRGNKTEELKYKIYMLGLFLGENPLATLLDLGLNVTVE